MGQLSSHFSHWNAVMSLSDWMKKNGIPGIQGATCFFMLIFANLRELIHLTYHFY